MANAQTRIARSLKAENEYLQKEIVNLCEDKMVLMEALQAIVNNWDKRMTGDKEILKKGGSELQFDYWSPSASMVSSEFIASAREALNKVNQK